MSLESTPREPSFAEVFEQVLVPAVFDRYARDLVERARPVRASERMLDLGCGTGIVARILRERLGGAASIVGLDANAAMIAQARSLAPDLDFREGNAMALPFPDASFDLVLCQQMLQFVPDRLLALREVRRVLSRGGRLIASTWRPRSEQPLHDALGRIAERHLGKSNDSRWSLDGAALGDVLARAGFTDIRIETVSLTECFPELPARLSTKAGGFDLSALSEAERDRRFAAIETDSAELRARFAQGNGFGAPSVANIATAIAP